MLVLINGIANCQSEDFLDEFEKLIDNENVQLIPDKMIITQKIFWGEKCLLRKVEDFNSGNSSLDSNAMGAVEALRFPNVIFRSNSIEHNGETIYIAGSLEFHGIKKDIEIEAEIEDTEDLIKIYTTFKVKLSDFEIKRPSLFLKK